MSFFPSMAVFLKIGDNIEIRWYALCILFGAFLAYYFANKAMKQSGYDSDTMDDLFMGALLCGIVGARLWYCLFYDLSGYIQDLSTIFQIWDGGLAIQGGLFGGAVFVYFYCRKHNFSFIHIADLVLPTVLLAQAMGRWGNYFNQEAYGKVVDSTYFDGWLNFIKEGMYISGNYRQPMFIYESILCFVGFVLIMLYRKYNKHHRGDGTFCYLAWYGAIRFWIESQRADSLMVGNYRVAQIVSIIFLLIGIPGLLGAFRGWINKEKPVIVFDLDGTLLDTTEAIYRSFEHTFKKYAPDLVLTDEDRASFLGPTLAESFNKYVPGCNVDELTEYYREYNAAIHEECVKPVAHVPELLQWLKENGYQIAIGSSKKSSTIRLGLDVTGLTDYFDIIVGVEDVTKPKPDKETIIKSLDLMGGRRDCAIYVGDSAGDMVCARNAGVYGIGITTNQLFKDKLAAAKPNRMIDDMLEIEQILQEKDHSWTNNLY